MLPELREQQFAVLLDQVYRTGIAYEGNAEVARLPTEPHGELEAAYYSFVYAPMLDADGRIEGVLMSAYDVSAQVHTRQQAERARDDAEQAATVRAQALQEAERVGRTKDEFLASRSTRRSS